MPVKEKNKKKEKVAVEETSGKKEAEAKKRFEEKRRAGQPLLFPSVEELQQKIDEYFASCFRPALNLKTNEILKDAQGKEILAQFKPFTISGLAYFLGTNRQTLINYQKTEKYFDTITRAKNRCEVFTEESLFDRNSCNGAKFVLINGYGEWKDKQEIEHKGDMILNVSGLKKV